MTKTLLALVLLSSQALSLAGPGAVVCFDPHGGVCVEFRGRGCDCCRESRATAPAEPDRPCGCCRHNPAPTPADCPELVRPCDCEHVPLVDGSDRPSVGAERPDVERQIALTAWGDTPAPWATSPAGDRRAPAGRDPPPAWHLCPAHLSLTACAVLRC